MSKETNLKHSTLAAALAAFQTEVPLVEKKNTGKVEMRSGGSYSYDYASLTDVTKIALPLLGKHGLAFSTLPITVDSEEGKMFMLRYMLLHESGEMLEGMYPLGQPNAPAQVLGSAITYARRYALCAVTGIAPGGDDDDADMATKAASQQKPARAAAKPTTKPTAPTKPVEAPVKQPAISEEDLAEVKAMVDAATTVDELRQLWDKSNDGNFLTAELKAIINARREALESEVPKL